MAGRRPKPTAVKRLTGNPGKRPLNDSEPKPRAASGRSPRGMSPGAKRLWHGVAEELVRLGLLTVVDVPAFRLMCEHFGLAVNAAQRLEQDGLITVDEHGLPRKSPLAQVLRDASSSFRQYAVEFGMTPSSRSRLHMEGEDQDDFMSLLFGTDVEIADRPGEQAGQEDADGDE